MQTNVITSDILEEFQKNGVVCLRQVFNRDWINKIAVGIDKNIASPSQYGEMIRNAGGGYFGDYFSWKRIEEFRDFAMSSPAAEIAGRLMQSEFATFYYEHVLAKEPGTLKDTPWHQDWPYHPVNGVKNCSIWFPVDPIDTDTCVQYVKGSHQWGTRYHPRNFAEFKNYDHDNAKYTFDGVNTYEDVPEINENRFQILKWSLQPGDCLVFSMFTLHGAPGNISHNRSRRVLVTRWLGDDAVIAERPWKLNSPFYGGLKQGDLVTDSDEFPVVWRKE